MKEVPSSVVRRSLAGGSYANMVATARAECATFAKATIATTLVSKVAPYKVSRALAATTTAFGKDGD